MHLLDELRTGFPFSRFKSQPFLFSSFGPTHSLTQRDGIKVTPNLSFTQPQARQRLQKSTKLRQCKWFHRCGNARLLFRGHYDPPYCHYTACWVSRVSLFRANYKLKFFLFFLFENETVSCCGGPFEASCRAFPSPNPAAMDLHVA